MVLATGELVRASATENPDLFWGLRGGGGNFGVVTSFTFRAHPLDPDVFAGSLIYELPRWREALDAYVAWTADVPDEITTLVTFMVPPPDWELGDRVLMFLGFAWAGADRAEGMAVIERLQAACPPDVGVMDPTRWLAFQSAFDAAMPKGVRAYWRNASFERFDGAMIDALVEHCGAQTWVGTAADLHHMGGAFGRVAEDATAFPNRSAEFWLNIYGFWPDAGDDAARIAWVKGFSDAMRPHAMAGQYVNFLGHDDADAHRKALAVYGPAKLERLMASSVATTRRTSSGSTTTSRRRPDAAALARRVFGSSPLESLVAGEAVGKVTVTPGRCFLGSARRVALVGGARLVADREPAVALGGRAMGPRLWVHPALGLGSGCGRRPPRRPR